MRRLASVLRSLREDAGWTQEDLAEKSGLSARTISDIERGLRRRLYRDTAERLAMALGIAEDASADFVELARGRAADAATELSSEFRRRFVEWHADRVAELSAHVGNEAEWFAVLDRDEPNLSVALRWAADAGDTETLLRLGTGLFRYWQARGHLAVGRAWLERGLSSSPAATAPARMAALWGLAWLAFQQGDDPCTAACAEELTELASHTEDAVARRNAATLRGIVALAADDADAAIASFSDALELARAMDQPWLLATSLLNVGIARIGAGRTEEARAVLVEAVQRYEELGDERFRARTLGYLGLSALVDCDSERADALYAQSLAVFAEFEEPKGIAESLTGLATAAAIHRDPVRAARLGGAAERLLESFAGRALPVERRLAEIEFARVAQEIGADAWHDNWTAGRALRLSDAIEAAL